MFAIIMAVQLWYVSHNTPRTYFFPLPVLPLSLCLMITLRQISDYLLPRVDRLETYGVGAINQRMSLFMS